MRGGLRSEKCWKIVTYSFRYHQERFLRRRPLNIRYEKFRRLTPRVMCSTNSRVPHHFCILDD